mmetsp:Transcript_86466/g.137248  ORF Transcript_86466/g.137248 Transcript_86466/m.137248 type:complete len:244 (-) Transcript_86466:399-1130(-)
MWRPLPHSVWRLRAHGTFATIYDWMPSAQRTELAWKSFGASVAAVASTPCVHVLCGGKGFRLPTVSRVSDLWGSSNSRRRLRGPLAHLLRRHPLDVNLLELLSQHHPLSPASSSWSVLSPSTPRSWNVWPRFPPPTLKVSSGLWQSHPACFPEGLSAASSPTPVVRLFEVFVVAAAALQAALSSHDSVPSRPSSASHILESCRLEDPLTSGPLDPSSSCVYARCLTVPRGNVIALCSLEAAIG